jgi:AraC-like DNA-binding protein/mannose-6-phosphate isomerase-like protein (cupin superfamily)
MAEVLQTSQLGFIPFTQHSDQTMTASSRSWHALDLAIQQGTRVIEHAPLPLHQHEEHEVNLVVQGFGRIALEQQTCVPFGAGQVLFLPSGLRHRIDASCQLLLKGFHIHPQTMRLLTSPTLTADLQAYFTVLTGLPATVIHTHSFQLMLDMVELSIEEMRHLSDWHTDSMLAIRQWLCVTVLRILNDNVSDGQDYYTLHRVAQVKTWIDAHYQERVTLTELAAKANLSPTHFSLLFHQLYQVAPKTYQRQCCLRHAAQQLLQSDLPVTVIGVQHGFIDMAHFSRTFRDYLGMSPTQYRQAHQAAAHALRVCHDTHADTTAPKG